MTASPTKDYAAPQQPQDGQLDWFAQKRVEAFDLVSSSYFDIVIGIIIVGNAISIGVEQSLRLGGHDLLFIQIVESLFLVIYMGELALRIMAHGVQAFLDRWVIFDMILLAVGILTAWILQPLFGAQTDAFTPLMLLRVARLLRLTKTMRLFIRFKEFYMLIRGFLHSANIMLYTFLTVLFILYVFASLGLEVIAGHSLNKGDSPDVEFQRIVDHYFSSLPIAMLTLMQFTCWDNMAGIYKPLIEMDGTLALYFMSLIFVVSILLMNLVTAVVISSTFEQNSQDQDNVKRGKEAEWAKLISDLKIMFLRLDEDKSGQLSRNELMNIDPEDQQRLCEALGVNTPMEVFNALDTDGSGQVSIIEFFDGIWDVVLAKAPLDLKRMEKQVETMHWRMKVTFQAIHEMHVDLTQRITKLCDGMDTASTTAESDEAQALKETAEHKAQKMQAAFDSLKYKSWSGNDPHALKGMPQKPPSTIKAKAVAKKTASGPVDKVTAENGDKHPPMPPWAQDLSQKLKDTFEDTIKATLKHVETAASLDQSGAPVNSAYIRRMQSPSECSLATTTTVNGQPKYQKMTTPTKLGVDSSKSKPGSTASTGKPASGKTSIPGSPKPSSRHPSEVSDGPPSQKGFPKQPPSHALKPAMV